MLRISGESRFNFTDKFEDPVDMDFETGGTPYDISREWTASFSAEVLKDRQRSIYFDPKKLR